MLTIGQERSAPTEISTGRYVCALTFIENGEYLVSGDEKGVAVWRVKDGTRVARMETQRTVSSLVASKNGKWIAAGTWRELHVWNAQTYKRVLKHEEGNWIRSVDFSPDSTRLVAGTDNGTAIVWDIATGKQVQTLHHRGWVKTTKYSPLGDRIATATHEGSVRVWDSDDGRFLVDIDVKLIPLFNTGLLWFNDHLLVISHQKIEEFDVSIGSKVSEWPVPVTNDFSSIVLPKNERFIAFSARSTITFWDTSTHNQLGRAQYHQDIRPIALSPDDRFLASGGAGRKITIQSLSQITVGAESRCFWRI